MIVRTYGRRSRFSSSTTSTSDSESHPFSQSQEFDFEPDDDDDDQFSQQFSQPLEFSQPPPPPPPPLLNFSAFSSQDSSFSLDHLDDSPPNKNKRRNSKRRDEDKAVPVPVRRDVTSTLMEAQEFGEMMESVDEVNFALDGLRHGQPRRVRRASLLSLLSICATATRRRILRAQGLAQRIIDAILLLNADDPPCTIAAAALFFVLASDVQDDHLLDSPSCIQFLLKLLNPPTNASEEKRPSIGSKLLAISKVQMLSSSNKDADSNSTDIISKVQEILINCKEIKSADGDSERTRPELCSKWIALLTIEKACLSTVSLEDTSEIVRRVGGNFKERLRKLGGLDAIFDVMVSCHSTLQSAVKDTSTSVIDLEEGAVLQSITLLLKCLKIMENATFLSKENQIHLLKLHRKLNPQAGPLSFVGVVLSTIELLSALSLESSPSSSNNLDCKSSDFSLMEERIVASKNATLSSDHTGCKDSKMRGVLLCHKRRDCSSSKADISVFDFETVCSGSDVHDSQGGLDSAPSNSCNGASSSSVGERLTNGGGLKLNIRKAGAQLNSVRRSNGLISLKAPTLERNSTDMVKRLKLSENGRSDLSNGDFDPFAFDEGELEPSKWEVLAGKTEISHGCRRTATSRELSDEFELPVAIASASSQSIDGETHQLGDKSSQSFVQEDSSLFEDCLLTLVKVLMNLTNDNPMGCQQIATCGGLDGMASLITKHFPSFNLSFHENRRIKGNVISDQGTVVGQDVPSSQTKTLDPVNGKQLRDHELDFLVAILGLLVNLVEKDSRNRVRLASIRVSVGQPGSLRTEQVQNDVIPMLCSIFLANQGAGEAAGAISLDDEDSLLQGEREAEMMIVEAYAALLLGFLSTESSKVREAIASCLPENSLKVLAPVLERFVAFHLSLNMISPETHSAVAKVIQSCKGS